MAGFDHHAMGLGERESAEISRRHARAGLVLFIVYGLVYAGYVVLSAFSPALMERMPVEGITVAILYGMSLIFGAIVLALLYCWICRDRAA